MALDQKKITLSLGYAAFGLFSFFVCLYLTFPGQAVAQRIAYEVQRGTQGSVNARMARASLALPAGVSASNVQLQIPRENDDDLQVTLDRARASVSVLSLLTGTVKPEVELEIGDGTLVGSYVAGANSRTVEAEIDGVDLLKPPVIPTIVGVPLTGTIAGGGVVTLADKVDESTGDVTLTISGLSIGPGPIGGFTIPEAIALGTVSLTLGVEEGRLQLKEYSQEGGQLDLELSGELRLNRRFSSSNLDACVKFKFSDSEYLKQFPTIETAIQLAGARFKKDTDGYLNIPLRGLLSRPAGGTGIKPGRGLCSQRTTRRGPAGSR